MHEQVVIIGAGQAGLSVAQSLRENAHAGSITLIGDEELAPYQRPPLSKKFLAGELTDERLLLKPLAFFEKQAIDLRLGKAVEGINCATGVVQVDGASISFDKLVLTTGTRPRSLSLPGGNLPNIHVLRAVADVKRLRPLLAPGRRLVIIGGGYIGLEVAAVAQTLGVSVTVIEAQDRVMARVVAAPVSAFYEDVHRARGVTLVLGRGIAGLERDAAGLAAVTCDQVRYCADLVLVAVGAVPNMELAAAAGLKTDDGIVVDAQGRTSDPRVFAAGDCTRFPSALYGRTLRLESVQNAIDQAKVVGATLTGADVRYNPVPWFWSDQYDVKLQIVGLSHGHTHHVVRGDPATRSFSVFYFDGPRLIAVDSINRPRDHMLARRFIGAEVSGDVDQLASESSAWESAFGP
jgi:3-phenylpropionate/trans-cinnamate dioxygenase ferredoxin reductase subunit